MKTWLIMKGNESNTQGKGKVRINLRHLVCIYEKPKLLSLFAGLLRGVKQIIIEKGFTKH